MEDPESYYRALEINGVDNEVLGLIRSKATSIGLQPVESSGAAAAIGGKTGFAVFPDYRNVPVLSAYAPLRIDDVNWAIMSEIDEEEAYRPVAILGDKILFASVVIVCGVLFLAIVVGLLLSRAMTGPVLALSNTLRDI